MSEEEERRRRRRRRRRGAVEERGGGRVGIYGRRKAVGQIKDGGLMKPHEAGLKKTSG